LPIQTTKKKEGFSLFFHASQQQNKKIARFSFLLSHIIPTKQKNSIKQDLSLFHALQQQNRKINEVFFSPHHCGKKKKKKNSFLFHSKILKIFFVPFHVAITKKNSASFFILLRTIIMKNMQKKIITWLLVIITNITSLSERGESKGGINQKIYWLS
jgi:hypothetical protein